MIMPAPFFPGPSKEYDPKLFTLSSEGNYKKGKQSGVWKYYWPGGILKFREETFKDGILNGTVRQYSRKGVIENERTYKDGKLHGKTTIYDGNGRVYKVVEYENGQKINKNNASTQSWDAR